LIEKSFCVKLSVMFCGISLRNVTTVCVLFVNMSRYCYMTRHSIKIDQILT